LRGRFFGEKHKGKCTFCGALGKPLRAAAQSEPDQFLGRSTEGNERNEEPLIQNCLLRRHGTESEERSAVRKLPMQALLKARSPFPSHGVARDHFASFPSLPWCKTTSCIGSTRKRTS